MHTEKRSKLAHRNMYTIDGALENFDRRKNLFVAGVEELRSVIGYDRVVLSDLCDAFGVDFYPDVKIVRLKKSDYNSLHCHLMLVVCGLLKFGCSL